MLHKNTEYHNEYVRTHRKQINSYIKKYYLKLKLEIFELLGNKCVRCGESDFRCLQIDHVNDNGNIERKLAHGNKTTYLKNIIRNIKNGSHDYQLLCANCNTKKEYDRRIIC